MTGTDLNSNQPDLEDATDVKNDLVKKTPPDGGYGWVVLFAVFVSLL